MTKTNLQYSNVHRFGAGDADVVDVDDGSDFGVEDYSKQSASGWNLGMNVSITMLLCIFITQEERSLVQIRFKAFQIRYCFKIERTIASVN